MRFSSCESMEPGRLIAAGNPSRHSRNGQHRVLQQVNPFAWWRPWRRTLLHGAAYCGLVRDHAQGLTVPSSRVSRDGQVVLLLPAEQLARRWPARVPPLAEAPNRSLIAF